MLILYREVSEMKKSIVRVLISICVAAMLFSCLGITAFADNITYTVKAGETVYGICQALGIDFAKYDKWIRENNNITSYTSVRAGKVLVLPGNAAKTATTGVTATALTGGSLLTPVGTATVTNVAGIKTGDVVVSYLINHKLLAGETVAAVCAKLGVDFDSNANTIKALSGIASWNRIPVGKVIVIPSLTAPAGSSFTAIVAHKVVGGETVAGICSSYGVDYGKNFEQLKAQPERDQGRAVLLSSGSRDGRYPDPNPDEHRNGPAYSGKQRSEGQQFRTRYLQPDGQRCGSPDCDFRADRDGCSEACSRVQSRCRQRGENRYQRGSSGN